MNLLVTGGAGFIGCNFVRYILNKMEKVKVIVLDKLTYSGNLENLIDIEEKYSSRYNFYRGDICDDYLVGKLINEHKIDVIVNFAAETHVDRSILDSDIFIKTNIIGTKKLLDIAIKTKIFLFIQISTDEVYGSLGPQGKFTENSQISPNNPYSASKAAADHLTLSYFKTHNLPVIITRCSNNYGPYQFPEKFIPLLIINVNNNENLPIYGDGKNIRDWIFVDDHSAAIFNILYNGRVGEVYNIGGNCEKDNLSVARKILEILNKPQHLIRFVKDRPGHDRRYSMDFSKLKNELGWEPIVSFNKGLQTTIKWYLENINWVNRVKSKEYLNYYELNYKNREKSLGKLLD